MTISQHVYEIRLREDRRGGRFDFRCAAIQSPVVWRAKWNHERSRPAPARPGATTGRHPVQDPPLGVLDIVPGCKMPSNDS
jgi:hypothetical protein